MRGLSGEFLVRDMRGKLLIHPVKSAYGQFIGGGQLVPLYIPRCWVGANE